MISILQRGIYRLIQTKPQTKILILDDEKMYALTGEEILITTYNISSEDCVIATGNYRLYEVTNETNLSDKMHLELYIGLSAWQGYLLPTGLPTNEKMKGTIIPTNEVITVPNEATYSPVSPSHGQL